MRHRTRSVAAALVVTVLAGETSAQTLGEIAEREKKRRAEREAAGSKAKVVTLNSWEGWQTFKPSEGDFSVEFPARPRVIEDVAILPEAKLYQRVFQAAKGNVIFKVATADLGGTAYDRLAPEYLVKVIASNVEAVKDVPCAPIRVDGHPGCEVQRDRVRSDQGFQTADMTWRVYVVKRRVYILTFLRYSDTGPAAEPSGPFFSSFAPLP
jgi:hypothetical protein